MAIANEPYGLAPLTSESLATLGHPLNLSDFNIDAQGRPWRMIRGQKTYYAPEWFDPQTGVYAGTDTPAAQAKTGQNEGFFHQGEKWNWTTGQWENPVNWANVIGTSAAGAVGGGALGALGAFGGGGGAAAGGGSSAAGGAGAGGIGAGAGAAGGSWLTKLLPIASPIAQLVGGIYGANQQAAANDKATAEKQREFDLALAAAKEEQTYNRNQYSDYLSRLSPYNQTGDEANARLSQFMGRPTASAGTNVPSRFAPVPASTQQPVVTAPVGANYTGAPMVATGRGAAPAGTPLPPPGQFTSPLGPVGTGDPYTFAVAHNPAGGSSSDPTVKMRAPDGTQMDVPLAQVPYYTGLGAVRV